MHAVAVSLGYMYHRMQNAGAEVHRGSPRACVPPKLNHTASISSSHASSQPTRVLYLKSFRHGLIHEA